MRDAIAVDAEELGARPQPAQGTLDPGAGIERVQVMDEQQALHERVVNEQGLKPLAVSRVSRLQAPLTSADRVGRFDWAYQMRIRAAGSSHSSSSGPTSNAV